MNDFLMEKLRQKKWYNNSPDIVKSFLKETNENGIVSFLVNIQNENTFGEILNLQKIWKEGDIFRTTFRIRNNINNQVVEVSSINWIEGQNPLIRGLVLIEKEDKITHILVEKKFNLVTNNNELKSFGIIYPDFSDNKLIKLPQKISKALPNHNVVNFWDLGYVFAENSLISGKTGIFTVSIEMKNLEEIDTNNVKMYEINSINELIESSNDSYLLAIISRLKSKNIL